MLAADQVTGIILIPAGPADSTISALLDVTIPIMAYDRIVEVESAHAVIADSAQAAPMATEHLLYVGRRSVGFIAGRLETQTGADSLWGRGYEEAMKGREQPRAVGLKEFHLEAAQDATRQLLFDNPLLHDLVVANNLMVIGALRALRGAGKRIPDDVAFTGH